jgi:hypothetical protein
LAWVWRDVLYGTVRYEGKEEEEEEEKTAATQATKAF